MYSRYAILTFVALWTVCKSQKASDSVNDVNWQNASTIYDFKAKTIDGDVISLDKYRGKVVIVVNVASNCSLTDKNYKELNELYDKYESQGLRILAFPSNQFMNQEPGTDAEIKAFMKQKGVRFDAFSKIDVNGDNAHPLYKFLKEKKGSIWGDFIKWNFTKFLVDRKGKPYDRYGPITNPSSMEKDIKALLAQSGS